MATEDRNPRSLTLDTMSSHEIVSLMNDDERSVLAALEQASGTLATAASNVARVFQAGGRIFLLGAGTGGRLAAMEAAELPATFGIEPTSFVPFIASGPTGGPAAVTATEDDVEASPAALDDAGCSRHDAVIALSASGTTPFVVAGLRHATAGGAWTCGIANNPDTPVLSIPHLGILLDTGPEILTGSTRLKAGTAQKLALNRVTTAAMVLSGRVMSNLMVEVAATNDKLRRRCIRIVEELAAVDSSTARALLEAVGWNIRSAVRLSRLADTATSDDKDTFT